VLSPLHGMILLAGVGAAALVNWMPRVWIRALRRLPARWRLKGAALASYLPKAAMCAVLAAGAAHLAWLAYQTNFRHYDSRRNPWVYAHPTSGVIKLGKRVEEIAGVHPKGMGMRINVFTPDRFDLWPVPWYLRRFDRASVGYYGQVPAGLADAPVIIFSNDAWPALQQTIKSEYVYDHYGLRPGVVLTLGVKDDLWKTFRREVLVKRAPPAGRQRQQP
jgi:hypothetical protein